jgi:hypothetical protein
MQQIRVKVKLQHSKFGVFPANGLFVRLPNFLTLGGVHLIKIKFYLNVSLIYNKNYKQICCYEYLYMYVLRKICTIILHKN